VKISTGPVAEGDSNEQLLFVAALQKLSFASCSKRLLSAAANQEGAVEVLSERQPCPAGAVASAAGRIAGLHLPLMDALALGMLTVCRRLRRLKLRLRLEPGIYPIRRKERAGSEHAGLLSAVAFGDWVHRRFSCFFERCGISRRRNSPRLNGKGTE
jgi:hypothetical protein